MQHSEPVVLFHDNQTRSQSRNERNAHTEHLVKKTQRFALIQKKLFGP